MAQWFRDVPPHTKQVLVAYAPQGDKLWYTVGRYIDGKWHCDRVCFRGKWFRCWTEIPEGADAKS